MSLSSNVKNFTAGAITLTDGTGTPLTITVALGEGDFEISDLSAVLNAQTHYETRGRYTSSSYGARKYPTFSFSAKVAEFSEDSTGTLADAILKGGTVWSAAVSTLGAGTKIPYALDVGFNLECSDYESGSSDQSFTLTDCAELTISFAEGDPNTFKVTGTVLGPITGDLAAAQLAA